MRHTVQHIEIEPIIELPGTQDEDGGETYDETSDQMTLDTSNQIHTWDFEDAPAAEGDVDINIAAFAPMDGGAANVQVWVEKKDSPQLTLVLMPGQVDVDDVFGLKTGGVLICEYTVVADDRPQEVIEALVDGWNASEEPERADINAYYSASHVLLKGTTNEKTFTIELYHGEDNWNWMDQNTTREIYQYFNHVISGEIESGPGWGKTCEEGVSQGTATVVKDDWNSIFAGGTVTIRTQTTFTALSDPCDGGYMEINLEYTTQIVYSGFNPGEGPAYHRFRSKEPIIHNDGSTAHIFAELVWDQIQRCHVWCLQSQPWPTYYYGGLTYQLPDQEEEPEDRIEVYAWMPTPYRWVPRRVRFTSQGVCTPQ